MKAQRVYEEALSLLGLNEEHTTGDYSDRAVTFINFMTDSVNLFQKEQVSKIKSLRDDLNITDRQLKLLAYGFAVEIAEETGSIKTKGIVQMYDRLRRQLCTGKEAINTRWGI